MTQPLTLDFATDANYAIGLDAGLPTKIAPSAGRVATGFKRDDFISGAVLNYLLNAHGRALEIMDAPALNGWTDSQSTNAGLTNANTWAPVNIPLGFNRVRAIPGWYYSGVYREALAQFSTAKLFISYDGKHWIDRGAHGSLGGAKMRGIVTGHSVLSSVDTVTALVWTQENSGIARATDNLGSSWYAAGTLDASFEDSVTAFGGFFAGRFFACARSQLYYHAHATLTANTAWTRITTSTLGWNGAPPPSPTCCETSPNEIAIGINGTPSLIYSTDGNTFAASSFPTTPNDGVGAMHWSAAHQKWIVLSATNNRILSATQGFGAWTELPQIKDYQGAVITGAKRVTSIGRTVIVAAGANLWASRDLAHWRVLPLLLTSDGVNPDTWEWLVPLNGRIWGGRPIFEGGTNNVEYAMSGTLPTLFSEQGAW